MGAHAGSRTVRNLLLELVLNRTHGPFRYLTLGISGMEQCEAQGVLLQDTVDPWPICLRAALTRHHPGRGLLPSLLLLPGGSVLPGAWVGSWLDQFPGEDLVSGFRASVSHGGVGGPELPICFSSRRGTLTQDLAAAEHPEPDLQSRAPSHPLTGACCPHLTKGRSCGQQPNCVHVTEACRIVAGGNGGGGGHSFCPKNR